MRYAILILWAVLMAGGAWGQRHKGVPRPRPQYDSIGRYSPGFMVIRRGSKLGIVNNRWQLVGECKYDSIRRVFNEQIKVCIAGKWGIIDTAGREIVPTLFSEIETIPYRRNCEDKTLYKVCDGDKCGMIKTDGHMILPVLYSLHRSSYETRVFDSGENHQGLLDFDSGVLIPPIYRYISLDGRDNWVTVTTPEKKEGVLDLNNKVVIQPVYDQLYYRKHSAVFVCKDSKWGLLDSNGQVTIPLKYNRLQDIELAAEYRCYKFDSIKLTHAIVMASRYTNELKFKNGVSPAKCDRKWGLIDTDDHEVTGFVYDTLYAYTTNFYKAEKGKEKVLISGAGNNVLGESIKHYERMGADLIVYAREGKYYIIDLADRSLDSGPYDTLESYRNDLLLTRVGKYQGLVDKFGRTKLPCMYRNLYFGGSNERIVADSTGKVGLLDDMGNMEVPCVYDSIGDLNYFHKVVKQHGKYGVYLRAKGLVAPVVYDRIEHKSILRPGGVILLHLGEEKFMLNDSDSVVAFIVGNSEYSSVGDFSCRRARVHNYYGMCGFIDRSGKEVVPLIYEDAGDFYKGKARANKNGKWGIIDTNGRVLVPFAFEEIWGYDGMYMVQQNGLLGFADRKGKVIIATKYDKVRWFTKGLIWVQSDEKWGAIDYTGALKIPFKYSAVGYGCRDGSCRVELDDTTGMMIDKHQKVLFSGNYRDYNCMNDGLAAVQNKEKWGKWGYINRAGKLVIPCKYERAWAFQNGRATVEYGHLGVMDKNQRWILPPIYNSITDLGDSAYIVSMTGSFEVYPSKRRYGIVDAEGNELVPQDYWSISEPSAEGIFLLRDSVGWGYMNCDYKIIIPCKYQSASDFSEGLAAVWQDGHWMYIDTKGRVVLNFDKVDK